MTNGVSLWQKNFEAENHCGSWNTNAPKASGKSPRNRASVTAVIHAVKKPRICGRYPGLFSGHRSRLFRIELTVVIACGSLKASCSNPTEIAEDAHVAAVFDITGEMGLPHRRPFSKPDELNPVS